MYRLSSRSRRKMRLLHPDLRAVVERAIEITGIDFRVGECDRTLERQRELFNRGSSSTMNSRHLLSKCCHEGRVIECCHAVDLIALHGRSVSWAWPDYHKIADAMKQAAFELNVALDWGGDWITFKDGPHFQLSWSKYRVMK